KEVGLRIVERASKVHEGQMWIKRVVAEMGGKDAIIVDSDTDLDDAAAGVVQAAFGFQGQKCSACSRAIIHADVYDSVLERIVGGDFDDALRIANDTEYGLTGAVYTNDREKLERARREFHVGNLYFNRKCTGALVGAHPFGGFQMSGTDSKAGGRDYLALFL